MSYGRFGGFSCEDCETDWLIGRRGVCDEANRLCICPPGFSGKDDFVVTQTCHINDKAVTNFHRVIVFVAGTSFVVNLLSLILLMRRPIPDKEKDRIPYEVLQLTKLSILFAVLYLGLFAIASGLYGFSGGRISFVDYKVTLPMIGGASVLFLGLTYNTMFITWYKSIPDPEVYGKVLNYPEFVTKYPKFVPKACITAASIWSLLTIIGFFILPFTNSEEEYGQTPASFFIFSLPFGLIIYCLITIITITSLEKLYKTALTTAEVNTPNKTDTGTNQVNNVLGEHLLRIKSVLRTIKLFKVLLGTAIGISLLLALTHIIIGGVYQYIFFTGPALVITTASIFAPILTLRSTVFYIISLLYV